eukprot:595442-Rhodomonas_salina.3
MLLRTCCAMRGTELLYAVLQRRIKALVIQIGKAERDMEEGSEKGEAGEKGEGGEGEGESDPGEGEGGWQEKLTKVLEVGFFAPHREIKCVKPLLQYCLYPDCGFLLLISRCMVLSPRHALSGTHPPMLRI